MNGYFHRLTGVHLSVYLLTDWLSLIPLALVLCFALLGLWQWIRRKSLLRVDGSLLALGGFYLIVMAAYVFFEVFVVNFRPVLINGALEASYPSSTTVLVLCVMSTSAMQLRSRIKRQALRRAAVLLIAAFSFFMIAGRMLCGVHWLSDIIGGALLSAALVMLYAAAPFAR
ncbi:MAG: phosphatase PAP2 family protein [Clostridia bacterium]|nr:phosphatase PAP2 family protein [Clostridia bacterium]